MMKIVSGSDLLQKPRNESEQPLDNRKKYTKAGMWISQGKVGKIDGSLRDRQGLDYAVQYASHQFHVANWTVEM